MSQAFAQLRRMHLQLGHELMSERHQQADEHQFHIQFYKLGLGQQYQRHKAEDPGQFETRDPADWVELGIKA